MKDALAGLKVRPKRRAKGSPRTGETSADLLSSVPTSFPIGAPVRQPGWRDLESYDPETLSYAAGRGITNALEGTKQLLGGARDYLGGFMQSVRERSPEELRGTAPARSMETYESVNRAVSQAAQDPLTTAKRLASAFVDVGAEATKSPASTTEFIADVLTPIPGPSVRRGPPVSQVVKPKGGDFPTKLEAIQRLELFEPEASGIRTRQRVINDWLNTKLAKYIRNEMATPEDPIRKLAEQGILHVDPEMINYDPGLYGRPRLGEPEPTLMAESGPARVWEGATDYMMGDIRLGELTKTWPPYDPSIPGLKRLVDENPWVYKVAQADPERKLYLPSSELGRDLGFDHLRDELFNSINAESGLPQQLRLTDEQLGRMSVPDAVRHVSKINKWREKQKAEANFALANNAATVPFKDYPDQKYAWYQLKAPTSRPSVVQSDSGSWSVVDIEGNRMSASFKSKEGAERALAHLATNDPRFAEGATPAARAALEDALRYEGDTMGHCVGGYCDSVLSGRSAIYSLRDKRTGAPHVTIEVEPYGSFAESKRQIDARFPDLDENEKMRMLDEQGWLDENGDPLPTPLGRILQIKGKANLKPKDEYIPFVQDFVKSQNWDMVQDLENAKLVDLNSSQISDRWVKSKMADHVARQVVEDMRNEGLRFVGLDELNARHSAMVKERVAARKAAEPPEAKAARQQLRELRRAERRRERGE